MKYFKLIIMVTLHILSVIYPQQQSHSGIDIKKVWKLEMLEQLMY